MPNPRQTLGSRPSRTTDTLSRARKSAPPWRNAGGRPSWPTAPRALARTHPLRLATWPLAATGA
eukprot:638031-Lingulodinium_polyedra.AAC.1